MSELPNGWTETTLGDVANWGSGGTPSRSESSFYGGKIPWIKSGELNGRFVTTAEEYITEAAIEGSSAKLFPAGSVAIAMYGATIGKTAILGIDAATNQACAVGAPLGGLIGKEFLYRLLQNEKKSFIAKGKGGAQPNISQAVIKAHVIGLPPLAEQARIVQKLDELLAQVDNVKARIDTIPKMLKRFRESVLAAAVSGRLTEEWRKDSSSVETGAEVIKNDQLAKAALIGLQPELKKKKSSIESDIDENYLFHIPENWSFTTWGKLSEWITYGFTRPMPKSESGVKLLTAKDVQRFELEFMSCGLTTKEAFGALSDKDKPVKGDLLITKDGSIGRAALVQSDEEFCINQSVAVCWLRSTTMNKNYLELLSNADFTQRFVKDKAQGMAIQHLSIIDFAKCPVPVPSNAEQDEIVRRVEQLFAFTDQLEAKIKAAQARVNHLTQSILAKAFRGELVPQDPNDEPASVLLERIKAQRAAAPKAKRSRKTSA